MTGQKYQTLKGFRDLLPEEAALKQQVIDSLRQTFESFGFQPLETPTLEYASTLLGKYGKEADKLIYVFKDRGNREVGLRYDLTLPTCKVLGINGNFIPLPFKRYQIQNVFRAEKPQKGRFREFTQCYFDIFGFDSAVADAEIILVTWTALKKLGLENFKININSRKILFSLLEKSGIKERRDHLSILQSIDKIDKKGEEEVRKELLGKGFNQKLIDRLFKTIKNVAPDEELQEIFSFLSKNNVPQNDYIFNPCMVRGLDYYTRTIIETYENSSRLGSISGGGRYDKLVEHLGGPQITGTGSTIGLDRILEIMKEKNITLPGIKHSVSLLVTVFSKELEEKSIQAASFLRSTGVGAELFLDSGQKLDKQLKYANRKKIPYVLIIGPDEVKSKRVVLKRMATGDQKKVSLSQVESQMTSSAD